MAYKAALSPLMSEMGRWKQFKKDTKAAESILLQAVCISAAVAPGGHCNATAQPAAHTHTVPFSSLQGTSHRLAFISCRITQPLNQLIPTKRNDLKYSDQFVSKRKSSPYSMSNTRVH